jgi:hypothetical protein
MPFGWASASNCLPAIGPYLHIKTRHDPRCNTNSHETELKRAHGALLAGLAATVVAFAQGFVGGWLLPQALDSPHGSQDHVGNNGEC